MIALTMTYYLFLNLLRFPTETWYYLVWMGVIAVAIDALIAQRRFEGWPQAIKPGLVVLATAILFPGVWQQSCVRMTNLDLVAQRLNQEAGKEDLVLIHPWFCGVTFNRYYKGTAEWLTLPLLTD